MRELTSKERIDANSALRSCDTGGDEEETGGGGGGGGLLVVVAGPPLPEATGASNGLKVV